MIPPLGGKIIGKILPLEKGYNIPSGKFFLG